MFPYLFTMDDILLLILIYMAFSSYFTFLLRVEVRSLPC